MNAQTLPATEDQRAISALPADAVGLAAVLRAVHALRNIPGGAITVDNVVTELSTQRSRVLRDARKLAKYGLVTLDGETVAVTAAGSAEIEAQLDAELDQFIAANPVREPADLPAGLTTLRHDQIHIGDKNPRKTFDPEELEDLAADIAARGLKTNLHARALVGAAITHELIAGERRWRAIGLGIERGQIPADFAIPVLVEDMTDEAHRIAALLENIQRVDLNPLEEAEVYAHLVTVEGRTTAEVAAMANKKNREYVQQRIRLNRLTDAEKGRMREGQLTFSEARRLLAGRPDPLDLTPRQALVLAEVITAPLAPTMWPSNYCHLAFDRAAADPDSPAADADLIALVNMGLLVIHDPQEGNSPDYQLSLADEAAYRLAAATLPLVCNPRDRRSGLMAVRAAALGAQAAEDLDTAAVDQADPDNPYKVLPQACAWLNGPFAYSPEQQAIADAIAARDEACRAENEAWKVKRQQEDTDREKAAQASRDKAAAAAISERAFLAAVEALEADMAPAWSPVDFASRMSALLTTHGFPPPFRVAGDPNHIQSLVLVAANGEELRAAGAAFLAIRRWQAMAINVALGFTPYSGPPLGVVEDADEAVADVEDDLEPFLSDDDDADDADDDSGFHDEGEDQ